MGIAEPDGLPPVWREPTAEEPQTPPPRRGQPGAGLSTDTAFLLDAGFTAPELLRAQARAKRLGASAAEVLIANGRITEPDYFRLLAKALGLGFVDREGLAIAGSAPPLGALGRCRIAALDEGPLGRVAAIAPLGPEVERLRRMMAAAPHIRGQVRITTPRALGGALVEAAELGLTERARTRLMQDFPAMSAGAVISRGEAAWFASLFLAVIALAAVWPMAALVGLNVVLTTVFLIVVSVRLAAALARIPVPRTVPIAGEKLPRYSILVPLYKEAGMMAGLVAALDRIDYPRELIDIKLIVEADDGATRQAIDDIGVGPPYEVVVVPPSAPRTKPKALSFALPLARGDFVVVFDAEDRPDPDQLKKAVAAFARADGRLGCLQAALDVEPTGPGWFAGLFATEYAGQFHTMLPLLAELRVPLPLGGTSNHFRREVLEEIGGWDPYNVTEDADIGIRLARFGYRAGVFDAATREEAPDSFPIWIRQRTRWMKGWMQTWLVHMRAPVRLFADLGPLGFSAFQIMIGGIVLSALIHPIFIVLALVLAGNAGEIVAANGLFGRALLGLDVFNLVAGYAGGAAIAWVGLGRRGRRLLRVKLIWLPVYWVLISLAAYRALWQLIRDPFLWEKTPHRGNGS